MELSDVDRDLLACAANGLALVERPFAAMAHDVGLGEDETIARLRALKDSGAIKRLGLVVRHRELGYRANAMAVWDLPEDRVDAVGQRMAAFPFVTLCYRRRRAPPRWPYNLFAMIHGTDRAVVTAQIAGLVAELGLGEAPQSVLFSRRRYKQRGANYARAGHPVSRQEASWTSSTGAS
ncbi:MAG: AsnC family protein [Alphaproteobacteria bacterium]|nr:AsnC family protein [Alphaproteobacteria bacterium]